MKRFLALMLLLASLAACASGSSGNPGCTHGRELCIEVSAEEPIPFGGEVSITLTVTSRKDLNDLGLHLTIMPHNTVSILDPTDEEVGKVVREEPGWINWTVDVKADQPLTLTRRVKLPAEETIFYIKAQAYVPSMLAQDLIRIRMTQAGGVVYSSASDFPTTNNPAGPMSTTDPITVKTLRAMPTETPWPTLTPIPATEVQPREEDLDSAPYPTPYP